MALVELLLLSMAYLCVATPPQYLPSEKNKIFAEEKVEGQPFYRLDEQVVQLNDPDIYRLPTTTRPIHYDVFVAMDFNTGNVNTPRVFAGEVTIQLVATEPEVNEIVIHCKDLTLPVAPTLSLAGVAVPVTHSFDDDDDENFLRISLTTGVLDYIEDEDRIYELRIPFEAPMRTDMYGIYESWYYTDGDLKYMATTQFQATSARKAFPCYDEPSFKATFNISIRRPSDYKSWSCTKIELEDDVEGSDDKIDVYTQTPVMSTYLIAIIVAEYSVHEGADPATYEVIARPDAIDAGQGKYAMDVGQELLEAMNEHTQYNFYDMSDNLKMTQAAIPDFSAGAMENWGLLTYREAYLMYDEEHTDSLFKQRIAYILSHEIAHMWFGNLVTCDWWDVLWLNEGFARYYQYYLTDWVETEMGFDTRFVVEQVHSALLSDSANNPQPLTNPGVGSPAAVSDMFSTISYNKGAAIIRMTEYLLGFEVHRRGLQNYLRARQYKTALPKHLFQELQDEAIRSNAISEYGSDFSVVDYYESFTAQPGHPVLVVNVNHQTGDMLITQRRFNINTGYSPINTQWIIPITFATESSPDFTNTKPTHIIRDTVTLINRGSVGDEWVIFNKQQTGYYRVNYDDYTWDIITLTLRGENRTMIHEHNRAQIVNDVFQFARSGLMTYTKAFNILSFLEFETSYAPWVTAIIGFNWIRNRVATQPEQNNLEALIVNWASTVMEDIGYEPQEGETFMRSYLRYQLAPIMCQMRVPACIQTAVNQFNSLKNGVAEVPVDSRIWVYCNALREGEVEDFDYLWNRFVTHHVYTEKILLLQVLGCTPHSGPLQNLLTAIVQNNEIIRRQDYTTAYNSAVSGNEGNTNIVLEYVKDNLAAVISGFGGAEVPLSYISSRLRTTAEVEDFREWAASVQTILGDEYEIVVDDAQSSLANLEWVAEHTADLNNYFENEYRDVVLTTSTSAPEVEFVPVARPDLVRPITPNLPDSASTAFLSVFLLISAFIANIFI